MFDEESLTDSRPSDRNSQIDLTTAQRVSRLLSSVQLAEQRTGSTRIGSGALSSAETFGGAQQALSRRAKSACIAFSCLITAIVSRRIRAAPACEGTTIL